MTFSYFFLTVLLFVTLALGVVIGFAAGVDYEETKRDDE